MSKLAIAECFHCGLPLPSSANWSVIIDQIMRQMCCPGCQSVAQTIVDSGAAHYYRNRTAFAGTAEDAVLVPPEVRLYDGQEYAAQFSSIASKESCEATLSVEGIRCAACVWLIERHLSRVEGIEVVNLNVATERLYVRWSKLLCKPSIILSTLRAIGYIAYPFDPIKHGEQLRRASKTLFRQLFIAGLSMMQVMMYAVPAYLATDGSMEADIAALMRWASLLLTIPAVFYSAQPFFAGAWQNMKNRALGMDVPVVLGISAAFVASVIATWSGQGEVYFDSVTMFIFLLLCSRYLELVVRRKAASVLEKLQHALPDGASRLHHFPVNRETQIVPAIQLREGDFFLVKPGEAIAADGVIVEGGTAIDVSLLTGESEPQRKGLGDTVPSGAVNATQAIVVRVTKVAGESTLSNLVKLIERAGQDKPQIAQWADNVAAWFVSTLLLFALIIFGVWQFLDPTRSWPIAIAVLVVSCPCALSLATPTALAAATDRLVRQGVLIVRPHVLETLHRVTHVIFDKTGTLTLGKPVLHHRAILGAENADDCLAIAAALEASNAHPLSTAITNAATRNCVDKVIANNIQYLSGKGLEGSVNGKRYRLGNMAFVAEMAGATAVIAPMDELLTHVYLGTPNAWLARFDMRDAIREDAREVVQHFKSIGKKVVLLSGDQTRMTQHVAAELGIDASYGDCLPEQKLAFVQRLQSEGAVVAMIGDGINDAAVLTAADVSFAMGGGATLAQAHADTVLLSGVLSAVRDTAQVASRTMTIIRQNVIWAMLYNVIAIPAAAFGLLNPWLSGIGMSLSSAIVVINALRLRPRPSKI